VRDRLLDAAEQVVTRDGISNMTLEAVAREAGVSKGGLLYHFPSKSALVTAIVARLVVRCDDEQQHAIETDRATAGSFTRAYLTVRTAPPKLQDQPINTALLAAAGTDPQYLAPVRVQLARWQARLECDGIDPVSATIVRLAADGIALCELLGLGVPTGDFRKQVIDKLLELTSPADCGETQT